MDHFNGGDRSLKFENSFDNPLDDASYSKRPSMRMQDTSMSMRRREATVKIVEERENTEKDILAQIEREERMEIQNVDDQEELFEQNLQMLSKTLVPNTYNEDSIVLDEMRRSMMVDYKRHREGTISQDSSMFSALTGPNVPKKNARFSTAFNDSEIKNSLVHTHSIVRKQKQEVQQERKVSEDVKKQEEDLQKDDKSPSDDNSLATEEDLENYLQELEEENSRRKKEALELAALQQSIITDEDEDKPFKLSEHYKFGGGLKDKDKKDEPKQKDLIDIIQEVEEEEEAFQSDDSFTREFYQTMHKEVLMQGMTDSQKLSTSRIEEILKDDWEFKDMIRVVDWNERRYQEIAKSKLKENSVLSQRNQDGKEIRTKVMSNFQTLNAITAKLNKERSFSQARATCLGISDDLLFVGSSEGQVWMFDRDNEDDYAIFSEKSKEFLGNPVTAIDIHPNRTEYVVLGYERGQLVLFDCTDPKKSIKVIKDHHKNIPIVNVKFCDWNGIKDKKDQDHKIDPNVQPEFQGQTVQDMTSWMFISIDKTGKVLVNSIYKYLFVLKASKHIIIDPASQASSEYSAIACRFKSQFHGQGAYDDIPMIAIGSSSDVKIMEVRHNAHYELLEIQKPQKYFNRQKNTLDHFWPKNPSLNWGHGHSPVLKDRPHTLLAVAWGPLIQLVVLIDHDEQQQPFIEDGYHILKNYNANEAKLFAQPRIKSPKKSVQFNVNESERERLDLLERQRGMSLLVKKQFVGEQPEMKFNEPEEDQNFEIDDEDEIPIYDESCSFRFPELFIEQIQFISDSTLMIITQNQEIRILHTQAFSPETYKPATLLSMTQQGKKVSILENVIKAELEHGVKLPNNILKSIYHQTLKFFSSKLVILTEKNIQTAQHVTWQQSVYDFKKEVQDDLILVFQRALDIYKGKIKGYAGIPDFNNVREISLKADLKLLIREIICQVIEKTQETNTKMTNKQYDQLLPVIDSGGSDTKLAIKDTLNKLSEYEEERSKKYQTLIRISIEFCVELKDCYFLFYDLFLLFQEEKLEDLFIKELEPFIMAGKFQEWELPNEVLQNHVIKYYKNDKSKSDALEKIIVNLNFNQCPKTIVLEFIHFSEQNYLTTALLFLYTQVIEKKDNTSCVQVLCSLFDLYKKSQKKNNVSMIDLQMLREFDYEADEKRQIEQSQIYLGYKILWIIRLFIDGKKFPQGNIREKKWRSYIHDVIQFMSTPEFLKVLLDVDAETFFRVISILFYPSKPFNLVESGRDLINNPNLKSLTHLEFLKELDNYCLHEKTPEHIKYQYLFFVANVVAKSPIHGIEPVFFYKIAKELLTKHRRYLEFNKNLYEMSNKKKKKIQEQLKNMTEQQLLKQQQSDEIKFMQKTENDFINLFKKSEPLDAPKIQELVKLAEYSQFNQVKIYLLEKKEEYIRCLQLLLNDYQLNEAWTAEQQAAKVIAWIKDKLNLLEDRSKRSAIEKNMFEQFKREVAQNIKKIVTMNPKETIMLIEEKFNGNHKEMVDSLTRDPIEQMLYLETLLEEQDQLISDTIKNYGLQSTNPQEAKKYIEFLKLHLRLCCQHKKHKVINIVEKMVKNTYYPIEDCLLICQEFDQIEAAFLLNKKLGKYFESVKQGIEIIKQKIDIRKLKVELYFAVKKEISLNFPITQDFMTESTLFDSIFKQILKICKKNSKEVEHDKEELVWYIVIDTLMDMKSHPLVTHKVFCRSFFQKRLNIFMEALVRVIPFRNFLSYILNRNKDIRFRDFSEIIQTIFNNTNSENIVIQNANNSIYKVNTELFQQFSQQTRRGVLFRYRVCTLCKRYVDGFLYDEMEHDERVESDSDDEEPYIYESANEMLKIFACKHSFHIRCLQKYYKQKPNEVYDVFLKRTEKLRCPTCNLKNFEIENDSNNKKTSGKKQDQFAYKASHEYLQLTNHQSSGSHFLNKQQLDDDPVSRKLQLRQIRATMKSMSFVNKKLMKLTKTMEFYEEQKDLQSLNINDFKKIR